VVGHGRERLSKRVFFVAADLEHGADLQLIVNVGRRVGRLDILLNGLELGVGLREWFHVDVQHRILRV
jgi:hypothetical protein